MSESKEPIRLRQRKMATGNISLYLDIYIDGKRTYEYLKMYLIPEKTRADKEKNKETLKLADAVRAKRVIELRNGQFGFKNKTTGKLRFFDYYRELCEKRLGEESRGNWGNWYSCLHLEKPCDFDPFGQTGLSPFGYNMIDPLKSWCWGSILFYPFKISRFS